MLRYGTCDTETTSQPLPGGKFDPSPYNEDNYLVSAGFKTFGDEQHYICFNHNTEPPTPDGKARIQEWLHSIDVFVAHNAKFDLAWLRAIGLDLPVQVWDTMIYEWIVGRHNPSRNLDLTSCCARYGIPPKGTDKTEYYLKQGIGFEAMPWDVVESYGRQDVDICTMLAMQQIRRMET